jgi:hypothetical protein
VALVAAFGRCERARSYDRPEDGTDDAGEPNRRRERRDARRDRHQDQSPRPAKPAGAACDPARNERKCCGSDRACDDLRERQRELAQVLLDRIAMRAAVVMGTMVMPVVMSHANTSTRGSHTRSSTTSPARSSATVRSSSRSGSAGA